MSDEWLPDLVRFEDSSGDWATYLDALYRFFTADFIHSKPRWPGKRVALKRYPEYQGKAATFWHMIPEGGTEDERIPDFRRCERIRWPRPIMEAFPNRMPDRNDRVSWWKSKRGSDERIVLALADFSYLVVVAERADFVMPWTAYSVAHEHRRGKLRREHEEYWKNQRCP